jgi:hypothetical protein
LRGIAPEDAVMMIVDRSSRQLQACADGTDVEFVGPGMCHLSRTMRRTKWLSQADSFHKVVRLKVSECEFRNIFETSQGGCQRVADTNVGFVKCWVWAKG